MAGTIVEGRTVGDNRTLTPDFCVIGSGAGGGVTVGIGVPAGQVGVGVRCGTVRR